MKDSWEEKIFQEEYIREKARNQYREDLERVRSNKTGKLNPISLIGLAALILFAFMSLFGVSVDTVSKVIMYFLIIIGTIVLAVKLYPLFTLK